MKKKIELYETTPDYTFEQSFSLDIKKKEELNTF